MEIYITPAAAGYAASHLDHWIIKHESGCQIAY